MQRRQDGYVWIWKLTLGQVVDALAHTDTESEESDAILVIPPIEDANCETDKDSDISDIDGEHQFIHLPAKLLNSVAEERTESLQQPSLPKIRKIRAWSDSKDFDPLAEEYTRNLCASFHESRTLINNPIDCFEYFLMTNSLRCLYERRIYTQLETIIR